MKHFLLISLLGIILVSCSSSNQDIATERNPNCLPVNQARANVGRTTWVCGKVSSTNSVSSGAFYVNFVGSDFYGISFHSWWPPEKFAGRCLMIYGKIENYGVHVQIKFLGAGNLRFCD
jgi:hypothetical protein